MIVFRDYSLLTFQQSEITNMDLNKGLNKNFIFIFKSRKGKYLLCMLLLFKSKKAIS